MQPAWDIDWAMQTVAEAVQPYPQAALFELAQEGFDSVFEILVACIISIRTRDEVTLPLSRKFFERAPTAQAAAAMGVDELDELIASCTFHQQKAARIHRIARTAVTRFEGRIPCSRETLLSFPGVGPKCANLTLAIACGRPYISVDIHVHRISNRWGYLHTGQPEESMLALEQVLPRRYWIDINRLLVPFGKHICTGGRPRCSSCPLSQRCPRIGVAASR